MSRLRGLFFSLGLAAMAGLMAGEARAETLTLSVFAGTDTTAPALYSTTGGATAVSADTGILNGNLAAAGFGAYSFTNLGGSSNNPGTLTTGAGAFILASGNLTVTHGLTGEGTPITVVLSEGGFTLPKLAPTLFDRAQSNVASATSSSQDSTGVFTDATGASVSTPTGSLGTAGGDVITSHALGPYVTPFTLESQTVLSMVDAATGILPGSNGFSQKITLASAIPEPASLVMMLTGMPLPLVVMGLLRRRRGAA